MTEITSMVMDPVLATTNTIIEALPIVIAAIIILLIGWVAGRVLGRIGALITEKIRFAESFEKTNVGKAVLHSGCSLPDAVDYLIRIIVYLLAIMSAADMLQINSLQSLIAGFIAFIPNLIAFVLILVVGLILVDYFMDFVDAMGQNADINALSPISFILRIFLYFIVIMLALAQLTIELSIVYAFIVPLAWGVGLGVGAAIAIIVGFGLKDKSPEYMEAFLEMIKSR